MSAVMQELSQMCPVAVVSGRDLADIRKRVAVEDIYYAGSHGFEIIDPEDQPLENHEFVRFSAETGSSGRQPLSTDKGCIRRQGGAQKVLHCRSLSPGPEFRYPAIEDAVERGYVKISTVFGCPGGKKFSKFIRMWTGTRDRRCDSFYRR
jgi:hypothetical protein